MVYSSVRHVRGSETTQIWTTRSAAKFWVPYGANVGLTWDLFVSLPYHNWYRTQTGKCAQFYQAIFQAPVPS